MEYYWTDCFNVKLNSLESAINNLRGNGETLEGVLQAINDKQLNFTCNYSGGGDSGGSEPEPDPEP